MRVFNVFMALVVALPLVAQAKDPLLSEEDAEVVRSENRASYDQNLPLYIEVATMNQVWKNEDPTGGRWGHAAVYIKGLCRVQGAPHPTVKVCEPGEYTVADEQAGYGFNHFEDPNAGLGFSVNREYQNLAWVATPGKDLFFYGKLQPNQVLNDAYMNELLEYVHKLGTHEGIVLSASELKDTPPQDTWKKTIIDSMDTDFALNFGRYVYTVKVPITRDDLKVIVDEYLNPLNEKPYHWNALTNNCADFVNNLLAKIGLLRHKAEVNSEWGYLLFPIWSTNLIMPAGLFVKAAHLEKKLPGVILDEIYPHAPNVEYTIKKAKVGVNIPSPQGLLATAFVGRPGVSKQTDHLLRDIRYIDLKTNLAQFGLPLPSEGKTQVSQVQRQSPGLPTSEP